MSVDRGPSDSTVQYTKFGEDVCEQLYILFHGLLLVESMGLGCSPDP